MRLFRFIVWAILMLIVCQIAVRLAPHQVVRAPILFMVLFVPLVLLPMRKRQNGSSGA
jgi:hypothetical protein